jgi:UDP:flavonoid glycosyltransferase YjiC (YdhE family)
VTKRIVIACWGSHGDLFPYIGLAKALKQRGHRPILATLPMYRANVEREGLELARLPWVSTVLAAPQPDWPASVSVTGSVFYNEPDPLPPQLEEFLAAGAPPVVFTLGTSAVGAAGGFYRESVQAVAQLGEYRAPRVARDLHALLTEPGYRERAAATAAIVREEGGAVAAAEVIDRLLR